MWKRVYATVKTSERSRRIWVWKCEHCFTGGTVVFGGRPRAFRLALNHVRGCRVRTQLQRTFGNLMATEQGAVPLYIHGDGTPGGLVTTSTLSPEFARRQHA